MDVQFVFVEDTGKGSLNATAKKLVDQILEARPMEAYLLKLGAGLLSFFLSCFFSLGHPGPLLSL